MKCPEIRASGVERDNRIISKIFGELWRKMGPEERAPYQAEAKRLAREHKKKYPNYRFSPKARKEAKQRRNVKHDPFTKERVAVIADTVYNGGDIREAAEEFDAMVRQEPIVGLAADPSDQYTTGVFDAKAWVPPTPASDAGSSLSGETPFRSPLLPPTSPQELPDLANLSIVDQAGPLSPLDLTTDSIQVSSMLSRHTFVPSNICPQAPVLNIVPLPDVADVAGYASYPPQLQVPAYAPLPSYPHGSLALSDMYATHDASFSAPGGAQDGYYGEAFVSTYVDYSANADPAFSFEPPAVAFPQGGLFDQSYSIVDPTLQAPTDWSFSTGAYEQMDFSQASAEYVADSEDLNVWPGFAQNDIGPKGWAQ